MTEYKLYFQGPYSINSNNSIFDDDIAREKGIYLWTAKCSNQYFIEYIGETSTSFNQRTKEHMIQVLGGNYRIPDTSSYHSKEVKVIWNGMWRIGTREKLGEFINSYVELAPKIVEYINSLNIFIAPINIEGYKRKVIEGALASQIKNQPEAVNRFYPRDNRTYNPKPNEHNIKIQVTSSEPIVGLPSEFWI